MMKQWIGNMVLPAACAMLLVGCSNSGSDTPMATDGPNQVVMKVPGMS